MRDHHATLHDHSARGLRRAAAACLVGGLLAVGGAGGAVLPVAAQATPAAVAGSPVAAGSIVFSGGVQHPGPVSVADLQAMPRETVSVAFTSGSGDQQHTFTGVRLAAVLDKVGLATAPNEKNALLTRYLVVTANDGYQIVLSGGEISPDFGNAPILLAWEQDGKPLAGADGPLRLVVPGDVRGGRYVHGIVGIDVRSIAPAATPAATPAAS